MNRPNDARMDRALKKGDVLYCGNDRYEITGNCIGFGGSCLIYPARRVGDMQNLVLKECFPYEGRSESMQGLSLFMRGPSFVRRNGIVRHTTEAARIRLEKCKRMMEQEKEIGQIISNSTRRVIRFDRVLKPDAVEHDGVKYNNAADGLFAVLEQMKNDGETVQSKQKGTFAHELLPFFWETAEADHHGFSKLYLLACLMERTLDALEAVHEAGYLHGDIQEGNVLFEDCNLENGEPGIGCLIDFGCSQKLKNGYTDELKVDSIFTTAGYIPPEIDFCDSDRVRLTRAADIYSVGRLMCRFLFPETSEEDWANGKPYGTGLSATALRRQAWINGDRQLAEIVSQILQIATRLNPEERYQSASEMREDIRKLMDKTAPPKFVLGPGLSSAADFVPGSRDKELREIDRMLQEDGRVFLWGVGGIGKTETAVQYAKSHKGIKGAYLVHYKGTMLETVNAMVFSGYYYNPSRADMSADEQNQEKFSQHMKILREHYAGSLFVVDDFYVPGKAMHELMQEQGLKKFFDLDIRCIFTTRYPIASTDYGGLPNLEIQPMGEEQLLTMMQKYCGYRGFAKGGLLDLIRLVDGHTLTVSLIAKILAKRFERITLPEIMDALRKNRLSQMKSRPVAAGQIKEQDGESLTGKMDTIYGHLKTLFSLSGIGEKEKAILRYAALLPDRGMDIDLFRAGLAEEQYAPTERILELGWITAGNVDSEGELVRIHPVIRAVCIEELMPTEENCRSFLNRILILGAKGTVTQCRQMGQCIVMALDILRFEDGFYARHASDVLLSARNFYAAYDCAIRSYSLETKRYEKAFHKGRKDLFPCISVCLAAGNISLKICRSHEAIHFAEEGLKRLDRFMHELSRDDFKNGGFRDEFTRGRFCGILSQAYEKLGNMAQSTDWAEQEVKNYESSTITRRLVICSACRLANLCRITGDIKRGKAWYEKAKAWYLNEYLTAYRSGLKLTHHPFYMMVDAAFHFDRTFLSELWEQYMLLGVRGISPGEKEANGNSDPDDLVLEASALLTLSEFAPSEASETAMGIVNRAEALLNTALDIRSDFMSEDEVPLIPIYQALCYYYYITDNLDPALEYAEKALAAWKNAGEAVPRDANSMARTHLYAGLIHRYIDYVTPEPECDEQSLAHFEEGIELLKDEDTCDRYIEYQCCKEASSVCATLNLSEKMKEYESLKRVLADYLGI